MEEWRLIEGAECYRVSNSGKVRVRDRIKRTSNGVLRMFHARELKLQKVADGTLRVGIVIDGKQQFKFVHRLVATAFIPNPSNHPCVVHKDFNNQNNCVDNLSWVSWDEVYTNAKYSQYLSGSSRRLNNHRSTPVIVESTEYPSISEASRVLNTSVANVSRVVKNADATIRRIHKVKKVE